MIGKQLAVDSGCVLRSAIGMMNEAGRRMSPRCSDPQRPAAANLASIDLLMAQPTTRRDQAPARPIMSDGHDSVGLTSGGSIVRSSSKELRHLPCGSRDKERVTPVDSAL